MLPSERRRARTLPRVFERVLAVVSSKVEVADELSGVALWLEPGLQPPPVRARDLVVVTLRFRSALPRLRGYLELNGRLKELVHPAPAVVLSGIAVEPARQGQGVGGALLAAGLDRADAAGLPVFLTTNNERSLPLYGRFGFEVAKSEPLPDGGPLAWALVRAPR